MAARKPGNRLSKRLGWTKSRARCSLRTTDSTADTDVRPCRHQVTSGVGQLSSGGTSESSPRRTRISVGREGVSEPHAVSREESRTRSNLWSHVQEIRVVPENLAQIRKSSERDG